MIKLTRLDKSEIWVNPHQIECIEATPDSVLTMLSGKKLVVRETVPEIVNTILLYRKSLGDTFSGNET